MTVNLAVRLDKEKVTGFSFINNCYNDGRLVSVQEGFIPLPVDYKNKGIEFFYARNDAIFVRITKENLELTNTHGIRRFIELLKEEGINMSIPGGINEKN